MNLNSIKDPQQHSTFTSKKGIIYKIYTAYKLDDTVISFSVPQMIITDSELSEMIKIQKAARDKRRNMDMLIFKFD